MNFLELAEKVLQKTQKPMKAAEIWQYAANNGLSHEVSSHGKTPWSTIAARIYVDKRDNPNSPFEVTQTRPKKFILKGINYSEADHEPDVAETSEKKGFAEKDLHSILTYYAYYHLQCYTKTINQSRSKKKEFMEWVHPDLVGVHFPLEEWEREVADFSEVMTGTPIKLFAFELKKSLSNNNLRESFFQTVSNASWANEGYLVAAEIAEDEEFKNELKRLSAAFGIGIIQLDTEDPDASSMLFPAKKNQLDWETINKLAVNRDFKQFLERVKNDVKSKEVIKERYDKVFNKEAVTISNKN
jgi:hypothetical protein